MDPHVTDRYQHAHLDAMMKGVDMPNWMLQRSIRHSIRLAYTTAYRDSNLMQEAAWGSADGYADEILRRRGLTGDGE